jgi:hypothetical protein
MTADNVQWDKVDDLLGRFDREGFKYSSELREEFRSLEAGRPLDALIERVIFGNALDWEFFEPDLLIGPSVPARRDTSDEFGYLPNYSTEVGDAFLVVDEMLGPLAHGKFFLSHVMYGFSCAFHDMRQKEFSPTAPHSICKAALIAELEEDLKRHPTQQRLLKLGERAK